jgi:excinuclease ABC subunit C
MIDRSGEVLYVGKAKNLKNRVSSYFRSKQQSPKTAALVEKIDHVDITVTNSETEALLLEQTLIKSLKPPFNILLRDDKSYPYIYLSKQEFPRLAYYRGAKKLPGRYFGPFPSAAAVRETLSLLQKVFNVRQCEDSFYRNRSRPCLQHQIERCKAPCVGLVSQQEYNDDVRHTIMFLEGKNREVRNELTQEMHKASESLAFEKAAGLRDQLEALTHIQAQQFVEGDSGNADVFAVAIQSGIACVQIVYVRGGRVMGNKTYFPTLKSELTKAEIFDEFIPQYYLGGQGRRDLPQTIIVSEAFESQDALVDALKLQEGVVIGISSNVRTAKKGWLRLAQTNADQYLASHLANRENLFKRFESLRNALSLDEIPQRLECFDISHTQGERTVASCVVFEHSGPVTNQYRRFNIEGITAGDDYAAMEQALHRRYTRLKKGEAKLPDILIVDGGKGQLRQARQVLSDLQVQGVLLLGIAKGESRKPGLETLFLEETGHGFELNRESPALHLIQHIRDEAHRFAIMGHRQQRDKKRTQSVLEDIPGIGPKRRKELLTHFGGLQGLSRASQHEIENVPGISKKIAEDVYAALHNV